MPHNFNPEATAVGRGTPLTAEEGEEEDPGDPGSLAVSLPKEQTDTECPC